MTTQTSPRCPKCNSYMSIGWQGAAQILVCAGCPFITDPTRHAAEDHEVVQISSGTVYYSPGTKERCEQYKADRFDAEDFEVRPIQVRTQLMSTEDLIEEAAKLESRYAGFGALSWTKPALMRYSFIKEELTTRGY